MCLLGSSFTSDSSEAYLELSQSSKVETFMKIVKDVI